MNVPPPDRLILALDTSSSLGSVALARGGTTLKALSFGADRGHSQTLLPAIESLFADGSLKFAAVELFAVVRGPGSFTGLRVGLASVRGLAGERACFGALAPDVAAWGARGRASIVLALCDLFHGEVFGGVYDEKGELLSTRVSGTLSAVIGELQPFLTAPVVAVGSAAGRHRDEITSLCPGIGFVDLAEGLAPHLAALAAEQASAETTGPASDLMPFYLRDPMTRGLLNSRPKAR